MGLELSQELKEKGLTGTQTCTRNQVTIPPPLGPKHHGRASRIRRKAKQGHGVVREKPGQLKGSGAELGVQNMETRICPLLSVKLECLLHTCYPPTAQGREDEPIGY